MKESYEVRPSQSPWPMRRQRVLECAEAVSNPCFPSRKGPRVRGNHYVVAMLDLNAQLGNAKTDHERSALEHQIEHTDREIDQLVYDLYGLSEEEIALVERATK